MNDRENTSFDETEARALQLGYLGFGVTNLAAWDDFAQNLVGLQKAGSDGRELTSYRMDDRHHRFLLRRADHDGLLFAGWEVRDEEAMRAVARRLAAHGVDVAEGSEAETAARRVLGFVSFQDPDGLAVEIYHGARISQRPFVSPRGCRFVAGDLGLGHIVLRAASADRTMSFYRDMLGLRVSDFIFRERDGTTSKLTFMHANRRHHSLALTGGLTDQQRRLGQRLAHVMVEYSTIDEVGLAFDEARARKLPAGALGRHTNDRMFSFYTETPSGFDLELGAGGITVDPKSWAVRHYDRISVWGHGAIERRAAESTTTKGEP